jgi:ferredoxin-NADP reductase
VRALVAFGSNLLLSHPAPERGARALAKLDFYVHCDLFMNPTAEHADIVLPVSSPWENEALRIGFEIGPAAQELVQLRQRIIPRQADTRSDMEIVFELARRLGFGDRFYNGNVDAAWNYQLSALGLDVDRLRRSPEGIRLSLKHPLRRYEQDGFNTQTGRAELYSERLLRIGQSPVPCFALHSQPATSQFPLRLMSVNNGYFCHSQHRGIPSLRRRREEPMVEISRGLAEARGVSDGDVVRITTRVGAMLACAQISETLADDVVVSDYGWWERAPALGLPAHTHDLPVDEGGNFNALIDEEQRDPISGALPLRSFACDVEISKARIWRDWRRFVVTDKRREASGVAVVSLQPADGGLLPSFAPGQFTPVRIDGLVRNYSLIGRAIAPDTYEFATRCVPGGRVSERIVKNLQPGDIIEVQPPAGSFRLPLYDRFPIVLIAGGIGITPFISYLESLTGDPSEPEIKLFYGARSSAQQAFLGRLEAVGRRLRNLDIITYLSRPVSSDHRVGLRHGRIKAADIDPSLIARRARFYVCGGGDMIADITGGLINRGVPQFDIFSERFQSASLAQADMAASARVTFTLSGKSLHWRREDGDLLSFAERNGIAAPSGCRVGQCESCLVRIQSGAVQQAQATAHLGENECLMCQAVPASDLTLEL